MARRFLPASGFGLSLRLVPVLFVAAFALPLVTAAETVAVNALVNPGFNTFVAVGMPTQARPALDHCVGVGHQAFAVIDGEDVAAAIADDPRWAISCDPGFSDTTQTNPWEKSQDTGFGWSNDPGTKFYDFDSDGDVEAVIPRVPVEHTHNLWQSVATPQQAMSADFESFEFTLESGAIPAGANNQIGLSFSPGFDAQPWVGIFWDGGILFRANDMTPDEDGRVRMDPATQGEIICPAYEPCFAFKAEWDAADVEGRRVLLGQARVVQVSFWNFSGGAGPVVIDDVAFLGQKTTAEGVLQSV